MGALGAAVAVLAAAVFGWWAWNGPPDVEHVQYNGGTIVFNWTEYGVLRYAGHGDLDFSFGLGYAHARDRLVQMMLMRIAAQGRLMELLPGSDDSLTLDIVARSMDFPGRAARSLAALNTTTLAFLQAYGDGINEYMRTHWRPFEFHLVGLHPEPWEPAHSLLIGYIMGYLGLVSMQSDIEKLLLHSLSSNIPLAGPFQSLFAPHLDALAYDAELLHVLREKIVVYETNLPPIAAQLPVLTASNAWAIGANFTDSGHAFQCSDPHLVLSQLPVAFYEVVYTDLTPGEQDDTVLGVTVAGVPTILMGRTKFVSFGMTYGMMDQLDFRVEHVVDGAVRRPHGAWEKLAVRTETILGVTQTQYHFFQSSLGRLEVPAEAMVSGTLKDGYYLASQWSWDFFTNKHAESLYRRPRERNVFEIVQVLETVALSGNFLCADADGNIALQQSGLQPDRRTNHSLLPELGWREGAGWKGLRTPSDLFREINPPEGFLASANNQHTTHEAQKETINIEIGDYRVRRIRQLISGLLEKKGRVTVEDMKLMQTDVISLQAQRFMEVLLPLLPAGREATDVLQAWDYSMDGGSRGALLFTLFYNDVLQETMGKFFPPNVWRQIRLEGIPFYCLMQRLDDILLDEPDSLAVILPNETRDALFARVALATFGPGSTHPLVRDTTATYARYQTVTHKNMFFQGRLGGLGRALGVDFGPYPQHGSHATIVQGAQAVNFGMLVNAGPIWRYVADMATDGAWTVLAGGPSGRIGSPWYASELQAFHEGRSKYLTMNMSKLL